MDKMKLNIQLFSKDTATELLGYSSEKYGGSSPKVYYKIKGECLSRSGNTVNLRFYIDASIKKGSTWGKTSSGLYCWMEVENAGGWSLVSDDVWLKKDNTSWGSGPYTKSVTIDMDGIEVTGAQTSIAKGGIRFIAERSSGGSAGPYNGTMQAALPIPVGTYTISYSLNGGTGTSTAQTANYNTSVTTHAAPTLTGYTFTGWKGNNGTTYSANTAYQFNTNLTLTAQWTINSHYLNVDGYIGTNYVNGAWVYEDKSNINGYGTFRYRLDQSGSYTTNQTDFYQQLTYGHYYEFSNIAANTGYKLLSNSATSGNMPDYAWTYKIQIRPVRYSIVYNGNGGSGVPQATPKIYNKSVTLSSTRPTRSLYDFQYWNTKSGGDGTSYNPGASLSTDLSSTDNATVNLYAIWQPTIPSNVRFTSYQATSPFNINLTWACTGAEITNYTISYKKSTASTWTNRSCGTSTSLSLAVDEETTYQIKVTATNAGGSTTSSPITVTTPADQAKIRIYTGSAWLQGKTYIYNGTAWVKAKKVYIYDGSQWKINSNN